LFPRPSERQPQVDAQVATRPYAVEADRAVVAEIVHARRVLRVEHVLADKARPIRDRGRLLDHADAAVGDRVVALPAVGGQELLEVVLGTVDVVREHVPGEPGTERELVIDAEDAGPLRRTDDLLARVVADRHARRRRARAGRGRPVRVDRVVVGGAERQAQRRSHVVVRVDLDAACADPRDIAELRAEAGRRGRIGHARDRLVVLDARAIDIRVEQQTASGEKAFHADLEVRRLLRIPYRGRSVRRAAHYATV